MSRHQAACSITGPALRRRLQRQGIAVRGASARGLAEETPEAYKDITQVVEAAEGAGLCRKAAGAGPPPGDGPLPGRPGLHSAAAAEAGMSVIAGQGGTATLPRQRGQDLGAGAAGKSGLPA